MRSAQGLMVCSMVLFGTAGCGMRSSLNVSEQVPLSLNDAGVIRDGSTGSVVNTRLPDGGVVKEQVVACGNGVTPCDPSDLSGASCDTLGLGTGVLACDPVTCLYDTSMCENSNTNPFNPDTAVGGTATGGGGGTGTGFGGGGTGTGFGGGGTGTGFGGGGTGTGAAAGRGAGLAGLFGGGAGAGTGTGFAGFGGGAGAGTGTGFAGFGGGAGAGTGTGFAGFGGGAGTGTGTATTPAPGN